MLFSLAVAVAVNETEARREGREGGFGGLVEGPDLVGVAGGAPPDLHGGAVVLGAIGKVEAETFNKFQIQQDNNMEEGEGRTDLGS